MAGANINLYVDLLFLNVNGFFAEQTPIIVNTDYYLSVEFCFSRLQIYKNVNENNTQYSLIDQSSSIEILKAYSQTEQLEGKLTDLFTKYTGLFQFNSLSLVIPSSNSFQPLYSPILFKGAKIYSICIYKQTNTSIRRHYLAFNPNDQILDSLNASVDLDCEITLYYMALPYRIHLNERNLNKHIFKSIQELKMQGSISGIQDELFISFKLLKRLHLILSNTRDFWHQSSDNKWLRSLNSHIDYDIESLKNQPESSSLNETTVNYLRRNVAIIFHDSVHYYEKYEFPDEDICLFRNHNYRQLNMLVATKNELIIVDLQIKSCLYEYINKYRNLVKNLLQIEKVFHLQSFINCSSNISKRFLECNHSNHTTTTIKQKKVFIYDDLAYLFDIMEFVGPIISMPIVAFLGAASNILIIITIKHKKNKKTYTENKRLLDYLILNSTLNIAECILTSFTLISDCLGTDSKFCSSIMTSFLVQYFRVIVIGYCGEALRTCSLLTILCFSIERYRAAVESSWKIVNKLSQTRMSILIILIVAISFLTSVNKLFEYEFIEYYRSQNEYPRLNLFKMLIVDKNSEWFKVLYLFHYILNDFVLLVANLTVDIFLVREIKAKLRVKKKFNLKLLQQTSSSSTETTFNTYRSHISKVIEKISETEKNVDKLVIYSFMVYFLFRFPEIITFIFFTTPFYTEEAMFTFGPLLINSIEFLYLISYTTNIFFNLKFNKPFRMSFRNLFNIKKIEPTKRRE